ncbi:hypothetical protein C2G38_2228802 [Gigaspora rosea]|uniref:Reelin domain-containing protein n=1 Tax=Gigaspora rosea TaxID=44941 RepID=A0A397TYS6_9GLOM|nr:hypothetical protein C2G38_2228802 [Gigaspora rosea]
MHLLLYTLFLVFAAVASAFPNGAGYDFKVKIKNNHYVPKGPTIFLEITGKKHFKGLLLYALDSSKNHVGQWVLRCGFKFKGNCTSDPKGTLTHNSNSTYLSSTTPSSSNIFNTSLNDVSGLDATPIF